VRTWAEICREASEEGNMCRESAGGGYGMVGTAVQPYWRAIRGVGGR